MGTGPFHSAGTFHSVPATSNHYSGRFQGDTEWNFGQILPIAMVFLPFWALVQGYAGKL